MSTHLYVLVGPSCGGKTTLAQDAVLARTANRVITCTTRSPRPGEIDGEHYRFLSPEQFDKPGTTFAETSTYAGHRYGTQRADIDATLALGLPGVIVLDRNGAEAVKANCPDGVVRIVGVFPPGPEKLAERMRARGIAESDLRWTAASDEIRWAWRNADRHVVTFNRPMALDEFRHIVTSDRSVGLVRKTVASLFSL